jgi:diguanylate cyclase (GGDEF)-like protein/PAS domain S-box-containing protein
MVSRLKQWATFAHFEREEDRRMARIQLSMIVFFWGFGLFTLIINFLSWQNSFLTSIIALGSSLHLIPLGFLIKNKLRLGSFFLTSLYGVIATGIATIGGGMHDYVLMLFPIIMVFSGLTARQRGLKLATALTLAAIGWLFFGETLGWFVITSSHVPDWADLIIITILVLALAWMVHWLITKQEFGLAQTWRQLDERKRLETELRKLTQAVEQSPVSIIISNVHGGIEYVNPRFSEITGYRREEVLGKNPRILQSRQTPPEAYQQLWETLKAGRAWRGEFINKRKDGENYYESAVISPITDANGNVTHYLAIQEDISEQVKTQQALKESEVRYRRLVDGLPAILYTFSSQRGGLFQSPYVEQVLGYSNEYLQANPFVWNDSIHPEDKPKVANAIANLKAGQSFDVEYRIQTKNGEWRWLLDRSIGRTIENDELLIEGVVTDITKRKLAEQIAQEKTQELERFFDTNLDLLCIADTQGFFRRLNREWETTLGYSIAELEGKRFLDFVHPDDMESTLATISKLGAGQNILNFENRYRCKDGSYRWIEWRSMPHSELIYAAARDITSRKQMEATLRESEKRYRALFNQNHDGVFMIGLDGLTKDANRRACEMLGYTMEEFRAGKTRDSLFAPDVPGNNSLTRVMQGEYLPFFERVFQTKDGQKLPVEISLELVRDEHGQPLHIQCMFRDINERKQHEAAIHAANQQLQSQLQEIQSLQEALRQQALRDPLTNLYNRRYLEESLHVEISRSQRTQQPLSVVILDLDYLKSINDQYGHLAGGDQALQTLAKTLESLCRESDTICRYGGDEFLVVLYDTPQSTAFLRAQEWLDEVRKITLESDSGEFRITFSAGVAEYRQTDRDSESILVRADRALYRAKANGRNRVECYTDDMDTVA